MRRRAPGSARLPGRGADEHLDNQYWHCTCGPAIRHRSKSLAFVLVRPGFYGEPFTPSIDGVSIAASALKVRVAAPPEDGRANEEVCRLLALALSVSRRAVTVSAGHTSRTKTVEIASDDTAAADAAISRLLLLPQP